VARKIVTLNVSYLSCPRRRMCACIVRRAQQTQNETADTTADGKTTHRTKSLGCTAIPRTSPNRLVAPLTRLRAQALLASPLATIWCRSLNCELACRGGIGEGPLWLLRICNHVLVLDPEELVLRSARDTHMAPSVAHQRNHGCSRACATRLRAHGLPRWLWYPSRGLLAKTTTQLCADAQAPVSTSPLPEPA